MKTDSILGDLVARGQEVFQRVNDGPIDLFLGCQERRPALLFITTKEPTGLPGFAAMTFTKRRRDDGRWTTTLRLERPAMDAIFAQVVDDLVTVAISEVDEANSYRAFLKRVAYWRDMFAGKRATVLGDERLRGLLGELLFLQRHAIPEFGLGRAIAGWTGPIRAKKDFRFNEVEIEVKAHCLDSDAIEISSLDQLADDGVPLTLATIAIALRPRDRHSAQTVAGLVTALRELLETGDARTLFEERLAVHGYAEFDEYRNTAFEADMFRFLHVSGRFPRLTRTSVPTGVVGCEYAILLASLEPFYGQDWRSPSG